MSSVLIKLLDKGLIVITVLVRGLILKLLISLIPDFTDPFGKFTKQLFLFDYLEELLTFRTASLAEFPANIQRRYDIDTMFIWRYGIISMSY